jgi:DNA excision repair protein ERCC-4
MSSASSRRHIPYLSFHKQIIREICRPQKDDLLILAKGLGMRRVSCVSNKSVMEVYAKVSQIICALLKTYDRKEDLVLVVRAAHAF